MSPIRPNVIWAMDFQFDTTGDGRTMSSLVKPSRSKSIAPSTPTASSMAWIAWPTVSDWCRFNSAASLFIDPGSPWQNAWIESFNGRLRDELLNAWRFDSRLEARVFIEDWRCDYNANRPHSAHGELTPAEFALRWTTTTNPKPQSDWTTKRVPLR
jgi:putative transposase